MDPNACLEEAREAAEEIIRLRDTYEDDDPANPDFATHIKRLEELAEHADTLAERLQAIDGWLTGGGFLPKDWQR